MNIGVKQLGKYHLREALGRGGMAEVWKAFDTSLQRYVAIKLMHADLQNDSEFVKRFEREAKVIASLHHPHIVRLHDFQIANGPEFASPFAYMVMEYIAGQTLTSYIRATSHAGKFPSTAEIVHLFSGISSAIDYAHQYGVIHRDIKPANILLDPDRPSRFQMGEPILTDFGIVKLMSNATAALSGSWMGTPLYMSPEQAQGHAGNRGSDLYSLGVILYEICTGVLPFQGETPVAIIMQQITKAPLSPDLINPNISPALTEVILRSLAKSPEERFPSASAMTAAVAEALKTSSLLGSLPSISSGMSRSTSKPLSQTPTVEKELNATSVDKTFSQAPLQRPLAPKSTLLPITGTPVTTNFNDLQRPPAPKSTLLRNKSALIALITLLLLLLVGSGLGTFYALSHQEVKNTVNMLVGHARFVSSGQSQGGYGQGINDQLEIELHSISTPAGGKSYYAWLLSDKGVSPESSILLGRLSVENGNAQFLYRGDSQHSNLIGSMSRLLITEENANITPQKPSSNQSTWHYYAELPQISDSLGIHQRTIDVLRDLLYNALGMQSNLQGGIDINFFGNVQNILKWANSSRDSWKSGDTVTLHNQVVRILDYLDGVSLAGQDVPRGPSVLVDTTLAQVPLIDFQENQDLVSYVDRMNSDLAALFNRPDATTEMRHLAQQADATLLVNIQRWLEQMRQDARQLVAMTSAQLLLPSTFSIVNDMANQAGYTYNGRLDPSNDQLQGGALWIHTHDQQLATFDIYSRVTST